jgi:hypothetical protein
LRHLRTQEKILVVVLTLLLFSSAGAFAQEQLSPEKKKELRKFDPADIVPEAREGEPKVRGSQVRESQVGRGQVGGERTRSRQNAGTAASAAPISAAVDPTVTIPPAAPAAKAQPLRATPSLAPKGAVVITQSAAPKTQSSEPAAGVQAPATAVKQPARSHRLSLPFTFFLLSLILLALGAIAVKLKRDLREF